MSTAVAEQLAFDLELDTPEWAPVWEPPSPIDGMTEAEMIAAYKTDDGAAWKAWQKTIRCRDCGELMSKLVAKSSCGGGNAEGSYELCDDCAALDGAKLVSHTTVIEDRPPHFNWDSQPREAAHCEDCGWWVDSARYSDEGPFELIPLTADEVVDLCSKHEVPRWDSRWGMMTRPADYDGLVREQAKRRARYLAAVVSQLGGTA